MNSNYKQSAVVLAKATAINDHRFKLPTYGKMQRIESIMGHHNHNAVSSKRQMQSPPMNSAKKKLIGGITDQVLNNRKKQPSFDQSTQDMRKTTSQLGQINDKKGQTLGYSGRIENSKTCKASSAWINKDQSFDTMAQHLQLDISKHPQAENDVNISGDYTNNHYVTMGNQAIKQTDLTFENQPQMANTAEGFYQEMSALKVEDSFEKEELKATDNKLNEQLLIMDESRSANKKKRSDKNRMQQQSDRNNKNAISNTTPLVNEIHNTSNISAKIMGGTSTGKVNLQKTSQQISLNGTGNYEARINLPQPHNKRGKFIDSKSNNRAKILTQKVSRDQIALPFITKKNSISDLDIKLKDAQPPQALMSCNNVNGLLTQTQQHKVNEQWSPFPNSSNPKTKNLPINFNKTQSTRVNETQLPNKVAPQNPQSVQILSQMQQEESHFGIQEIEALAEETHSSNDSFNLIKNYEEEQPKLRMQSSMDDNENNIIDYNSHQIREERQRIQTSVNRQQKRVSILNDIKTQFNSETTRNGLHDGMNKVVSPDEVHGQEFVKAQGKTLQDQYDLNNSVRIQKNEPSLDQSQLKNKRLESKTIFQQQVSSDISKTDLKKPRVNVVNTQDILQQNQANANRQNFQYKKQVQNQTIKNHNKKVKQQQNREAEIRKYFQANLNQQLQFQGSEFSTQGASAKFLEEYIIDDKSLLGTGGYAEVRQATHKKTGHQVAIKIYEKYKLIDLQIKQNLMREIKVLSKLSHTNIMKLYESIETLNNVYLICEFVKGMPLNEYVKQQHSQKLIENDALCILRQMLDSVAYLHERNICHRDVKLENIIIDPDSKLIKLIDFGFAVFSTKPLKLYCGTQCYMAPEIIAKKEYLGAPIDIWTCGIAFYAMVCGHFPFQAHTDRELTRKIQKGIFHIPKNLSQPSVKLIQRMLTVDPQMRTTSKELLNDNAFDNMRAVNTNFSKDLNLELSNKYDSGTQDDYEQHLDFGRGTGFNRQQSPRNHNAEKKEPDQTTMKHLVKLGYTEEEVKNNFKNESELIGQLYKRLLTLKSNQ